MRIAGDGLKIVMTVERGRGIVDGVHHDQPASRVTGRNGNELQGVLQQLTAETLIAQAPVESQASQKIRRDNADPACHRAAEPFPANLGGSDSVIGDHGP